MAKKADLAILKSDIDKLDIDKWEKLTSHLSSLKSKGDKLYICKLETTPVHLNKLSDMVKNDVVASVKKDWICLKNNI